jgi:glycerol-3-phosphate acyltransferase PlsY
MREILLLALAYISGSIPYAAIVSRRRGIDIRAVGSKNPGGHNVMRHVGLGWGALVMLLDGLKAGVPALLARLVGLDDWGVLWVGVSAMVGHVASPFLGFRGGKGLAAGFGFLFILAPIEMSIGAAIGLFSLWRMGLAPVAGIIGVLAAFALMIVRGASRVALAAPWVALLVAALASVPDVLAWMRSAGGAGKMLREFFAARRR